MFYFPASSPHIDHGFASVVFEERVDQRSWAPSGFIPGGVIPLSEIQIGETCYRLRDSIRGKFLPADEGTCVFWVKGFSPQFMGKGSRAHDAYRDWRDQVHEAFQELYGKRSFEMTEEELARWQILEDMIDVVGYHNETPIVVRQIGQVMQARPLPRRIKWIDGTTEPINLEDMPGEFARYKPGQPFEADVERDPVTWKIRKVRFVRRIGSVPALAAADLQKFWQGLPATNSLPTSNRKWTEE